jgi:hypothetical protein
MTLRVVVYAEGSLESGKLPSGSPGSELATDELGPAHILMRRVIADVSSVPAAAISFVTPLRDRVGRHATGTQLHHVAALKRLLTWLPEPVPQLAIVLVDRDADNQRSATLGVVIGQGNLRAILGVAVEEFEAWLVGDPDAVAAICGAQAHATPENCSPRVIKDWLRSTIGGADEWRHRAELAAHSDLARLKRQPSFANLCNDLGRALAT